MKTEEKTADSKGRTEIQFWYGLGSVAGETMEEIIKEFNESQDKVKVVGVQQADYNETFQKVQAAIAAKEPPAVYIGSNIELRVKDGMLADLTKYMDDRTPIDDYLEVFMKPAMVDDKVYGFPAYGTTQVIYYRKDILEKAGLDPKDVYSTWENTFKYSKEIIEKNGIKSKKITIITNDFHECRASEFAKQNGFKPIRYPSKTPWNGYMPFATREIFAIIYQITFAYLISFMVYQFLNVLVVKQPFTIMTAIALVVLVGMLYMIFRKDKYKNNQSKRAVE